MMGIPSAARAQRNAGYRNDIKWRIYRICVGAQRKLNTEFLGKDIYIDGCRPEALFLAVAL